MSKIYVNSSQVGPAFSAGFRDVIALQSASGNKFNFINNHVVISNPNNCSLYYSGEQTSITSCRIVGNVFEGGGNSTMSVFYNVVNSNVQVIQNNIFI